MPFDADTDSDSLRDRFRRLAPAVDYCALRAVDEVSDIASVRQCVAEPTRRSIDRGAMLTVVDGDGIGYAATSDLSDSGLRTAIARARHWARLAQGRSVFAASGPHMPNPVGRYVAPARKPVTLNKAERIELLQRECRAATIDARIVDTEASLWTIHMRQVLITADGGEASQEFDFTIPSLSVTAHDAGVTQTRAWGGRSNGFCQQGGQECCNCSPRPTVRAQRWTSCCCPIR
jgi:predicted Zn-dependent protease